MVRVLFVCRTSANTAAVGSLMSFDAMLRDFKLEFCNMALHIALPPSSPILQNTDTIKANRNVLIVFPNYFKTK